MMFSVIYYWTDTRQHRILLLNFIQGSSAQAHNSLLQPLKIVSKYSVRKGTSLLHKWCTMQLSPKM